jgi:hypothetical protein
MAYIPTHAPVHPVMRGQPVHARVLSPTYQSRGQGAQTTQASPPAHSARGPGILATAPPPSAPSGGGGGGGFRLPQLPNWGQVGAFFHNNVAAPVGRDLQSAYTATRDYATQGWSLTVKSFNQTPGEATRLMGTGRNVFYIHPMLGPDNFPGGRNAYYALVGGFIGASVIASPENAPEDIGGLAAGAAGRASRVARAFAENSATYSRILQGSTEELPGLGGRVTGEASALADRSASLLGRARTGAVDAGAQAWKGARALISPGIKVVGGSVLAGIAAGAIYSTLTNVGAGAYNLFNPQNPLQPVSNPGFPGSNPPGSPGYPGGGGGSTTPPASTDPTTAITSALSSPIVLLAIGGIILFLVVRSQGAKKK